jgi:PPK2 family polyphosphate:nucleotide phosphotransferase
MTLATVEPLVRLPPGPVSLKDIPTDDTPGFEGAKADGEAALAALGPLLADVQERLFAERTTGSERRLLLVLQGMDTSGKGGVLRHTVGLVDPQGVKIKAFKAPTKDELGHDFLWRIRKELPEAGHIGVFDRSHYEDVLIGRVHQLADAAEIERRYGAINEFEQELVAGGTVVLKCMLHISAAEQKERLLARLDDPSKYWKFNPGDVDERAHWAAYQHAYEVALERTNTELAPWHVVPSDRKWFRNLTIARLLHEKLLQMAPTWPPADFDVEEQRARLVGEVLVT